MSPPFWFRILLRLLPHDFRRSHAESICDLAARYAQDRSFFGRLLVWLRASVDLLLVAAHIRLRGGSSDSTSVPGSTRPSLPEQLWSDLAYGVRSLRRDLGFTVFSVLIVGIGVGASVTVFSVAQALLLRPLPFGEPDRLVWISNGEFGRGQRLSAISVQVNHVVSLRTDATQLEDVAGYHLFDRDGDHTLLSDGRPVRATRLRVTENFFDVLRVQPALGRSFTTEEAWDDGPAAILLTHRTWLRHFNGEAAVVGTSIPLDDGSATVVGVLPASFDFTSIFAPGQVIDYVAPYPLSNRSDRSGNTLGLIGRLAPGATLASARAELAAFTVPEDQTAARQNSFDPVIRPLREHVSGSFRPAMALLIGAVSLVMLIVCANLSNLLLARGTNRERELAIRAAMGAGRSRLTQQLLTESLLLSVTGAALGIVLAVRGTALLRALDLRIPMLNDARVDGWALGLAVTAALLVGLVFGVVPARRGARLDLTTSLKDGSRSASAARGNASLRRVLVIAQITLASLLLVASTLTLRSLQNLLRTDLGYEADQAIAMRIDPAERFATNEERLVFLGSALDRVRSLPGVAAVGLSDMLPMAFNRRWNASAPEVDPQVRVFPFVRVVSDGYFEAMGLSLVAGRTLSEEDGPEVPRVAIVNELLARQLWGDRNPVGSTVQSSGREYEVVGVVRSTRQLSVDQEPGPELFFSIRQLGDHSAVHMIITGGGPATQLVDAARVELAAIDPTVPLDQVVRIREVVDASMAPRRFVVTLLSLFAVFAVVLSALGIYAVISYSVALRRHEIGIHLALGATSGSVQRRLTRQTLGLATIGLALGLTASLLASGFLEGFLFGVTGLDPITYLGVAMVLGIVALAAGWGPARAASLKNPLDVLSRGAG